jgi:uncharacterized protein (TIGR03437 family)
MYNLRLLTPALLAAAALAQETAPITLLVDVENAVQYRSDIADPARRGADAAVTAAGAARAFTDVLFVGDIVAVNGKPARGLWTSRQYLMNFSPSPTPGFAVADVSRGTIAECKWEFLDADGRFIGALADSGLFPHAVTGGAGAFYGARGQMTGGGNPPNPRAVRVASMSEDPSLRRSLGGGTNRILFQIIPLYRPAVQAVYHADFSPVTAENPARSGETVIVRATGLGPLTPGTTPPGIDPFPDPPAEVNSPVEAALGGRAAQVINKIGWPGEKDVYRLDLQIPGGVAPGQAALQITAAWIPGTPAHIAVR